MKGEIFAVKRFAVHDGDGIRTTLFLKGCTLKCEWCHNPEGIGTGAQLAYYKNRCINCGECVAVCPSQAHQLLNNIHIFNRSLCIGCGECEKVCLGDALTFYGRSVESAEILPELIRDREFYNTNGGVTLSGGEPLYQDEFCKELLILLKKENINTAVDTCGNVPLSAIKNVIPYTDTFLYDIKAINPELHRQLTGQDNALILENLNYIDKQGCSIEIRIPYVPERNSNEIAAIGKMLSSLLNVRKVRVLGYHNYASTKYKALDMENSMPKVSLPDKEELLKTVEILKRYNLNSSL